MAHSLEGLGKVPELRKRLLYSLMMLAVYRIGIFVTVPGVDREIMANYVRYGQTGFLGLFDMFSGGMFRRLTIFALAFYIAWAAKDNGIQNILVGAVVQFSHEPNAFTGDTIIDVRDE